MTEKVSKWDKKWENVYQEQGYRAVYPNENIIRFIVANFGKSSLHDPEKFKENKKIKILDLGCGSGRHLIYLAKEGFSVYGIEGSQQGIELAKKWLEKEKLEAEIKLAELSEIPYPDNFFDAVIDYESIQHNNMENAKKIFEEVLRTLKPDGFLFAVLRSTNDYLYGEGKEVEKNTFVDIDKGDLKNAGQIHFFDEAELKDLTKDFKNFNLEHTERTIDNRAGKIAEWLLTVQK